MKNYFYTVFPNQIASLIPFLETSKDFPEWGSFFSYEDYIAILRRVVPEKDRPLFILSVFMVVLTDQALYTYEKNKYEIWRSKTMFPKFGNIGFGPNHRNPLILLSIRDKDLQKDVVKNMGVFVEFLVEETKNYFKTIFDDGVNIHEYFQSIIKDKGYLLTDDYTKSKYPELENNIIVKEFKEKLENYLKVHNV